PRGPILLARCPASRYLRRSCILCAGPRGTAEKAFPRPETPGGNIQARTEKRRDSARSLGCRTRAADANAFVRAYPRVGSASRFLVARNCGRCVESFLLQSC